MGFSMMELERRTISWQCKYKNIRFDINQNFFDRIDFKYDGWFTLYLILDIKKFNERIQYTLYEDYYRKNGNSLNYLKWTYGGISFYEVKGQLIRVGCDYAHPMHYENFKLFDLEYVKLDAEKLVDSLLEI